jgi:glycosyltransferase involved in cell wall biosynthesis
MSPVPPHPPPTAPRAERMPATSAPRALRIAMVAASARIVGGQGVQGQILTQKLREDGHDVRFVPIDPVFPGPLLALRGRRYVRTVVNQALYLPSLRALRGADVVHVFSASYWSFVLSPLPAMIAARALRRRVVLHYHSGEAQDHLDHWGALVHPGLRVPDEIVVPSPFLSRVFAGHGYRTRVIRNVVDTSQFAYRDRGPLSPRLLCARNLDPYYRVDTVLRAFALVRARHPGATLTLAGHGGEESRLRQLAAELGPDGIRFAGKVEPSAMPRLYDEADVFVNCSVVDNQPVSVLEAFAAGLPVVTTPAGGIPDMVRHEETGLLVPEEDPAAAAAAVESLLADPLRASRLAASARREVEDYTWPRVRAGWMAAYSGEGPA